MLFSASTYNSNFWPVKVMNDIRFATKADLDAIAEIYNYAIAAGGQTGHQHVLSVEYWSGWLMEHSSPEYPVWVMEVNGKIAGWASLSPYRKGREAFRSVAEISYYVHPSFFRLKTATALLQMAELFASQNEITTLLAIVIAGNIPSIAFLEKSGFQHWGTLPEIVQTMNGPSDHLYYGKKIRR